MLTNVSPLGSNGDFNFHTSIDVDNDLLDNFRGRIQVDQTLVDPLAHSVSLHIALRTENSWLPTHLISYMSHVLLPSPQGVLRVEILRFLVGRRTGPLTRRSLLLARSMSSEHTFSRAETLRDVRVMRILWILGASICTFLLSWYDILTVVLCRCDVGLEDELGSDHDCDPESG